MKNFLQNCFNLRRLDGHLGPKLTNMSADLLDVFGRNTSSDKICSDVPPSILSPSICVNPVGMEPSKVTDEDFDLVYYNDANKGSLMISCPVYVICFKRLTSIMFFKWFFPRKIYGYSFSSFNYFLVCL